ncbi:MFS transporter [Heyndrickxia oleronia]|uniref:MFS transporter n=1 Tax=Heyndrickxia oleronia TaxID=38875 RepID=A0A8E2IDG0_9BACI|nr:MFS transporter [Heyndrickxia oleronia]MCI1593333.1 MFS transporter [Heyndrickxia oleronia]MCI1613040.1 MFS transporter [Heyndrickxia oleronia]MCI1761070.1 MFS transporter [Heyndrickxia oleronia]MEC1375244.1 MFS transporter [Heyndrickxia oleronia]OOP67891.1 MFS transporter [Heyndrickxia oleronia]
MSYIKRGTKSFRMANLALFAGGFNTFAILWSTQPLLPEIANEFHISPAVSSLTLSSTTIALAISMLVVGSLSEVFGRKSVMTISLIASSILAIITALSPNFHLLLLCRILQGIVLAGLPAIAMAYLGEEIDPKSLGMAMGLYISGNSIGGMGGRIISGVLTDYFNWHIALIGIGIISLMASLLFWFTLPTSAHFQPRKFAVVKLGKSLISQFNEPGLIYLFGTGFLLMGSFVSLYNYIGFQLIAPPYSLSQTIVGFIFIVYIVGTFSSTWMGMLADQHGRRKILQLSLLILLIGACITLNTNLWLKIIGIAVFTFGFFAGHSIASGWVGKLSTHDKAQASSLYLFFYYIGSSIGGTVGGMFYSDFGWIGVIVMIIVFTIIAIGLSVRLGTIAKRKLQLSSQKL